MELKFKLRTIYEAEIKHEKNHDKNFAGYDDNDISAYPGSETGEPWLFLRPYGLSFLYFNPNRRGKKESVLDALNFTVNPEDGIYTPAHDKDFYLRMHSFSQSPEQIIDINLCNDIDLAYANVYPDKTLTVELYSVCESDDDKVNYCVDSNGNYNGYLKANCIDSIDSRDFVCIDPGPDGSLDLFYVLDPNNNHWEKKVDESKKLDSLSRESNIKFHTLRVHAGEDLFCNSEPLPENIDCSKMLSENEIVKIQENANKIFSQGGIEVIVNYNGFKNINYDCRKEDNKLETSNESYYSHVMEYGEDRTHLNKALINQDKVVVYLLDKIINGSGATIRGAANDFGTNACFISIKNKTNRTIAHEIGHAYYSLAHPDQRGAAIMEDGLQDSTSMDFYNFMNSGDIYSKTTHDIDKYKLRKYQWDKMQNN